MPHQTFNLDISSGDEIVETAKRESLLSSDMSDSGTTRLQHEVLSLGVLNTSR